jgi:probable phosphoglycerate mutase
MSTIYLIRHGEIPRSEPRRFVGRQDLPLTERGRDQMTRLADYLTTQSITGIVTSPLLRCLTSAGILQARLGGGEPKVVADLQEISLGAWEDLTVEQVRHRFPGSWEARGKDPAEFQPPAGESFCALLDRVWPAFLALAANKGDRVAIVAHAGVNRVLLCRILGMPLGHLFRLEQDYGCVNVLHHNEAGYRAALINFRP